MLNRRLLIASAPLLPAILLPAAAHAQGEDFDRFVGGVMAEARRAGISDATLRAAFAGIGPNARVIELDRHQAEFTMTWPEYRNRLLPPAKQLLAQQNYAREQNLLAAVQQRFGVPPSVVMGIWGIESGFGVNKGNYRLVEAIATLAWEGRRAAYFRKELINALRILDARDVTPGRATSGWAGAMGQPQFMPSSYLTYAVDFDGDGRRDIWDSKADVFGSIANYLAKSGWRSGQPWGQPVAVPPSIDPSIAGRSSTRTLAAWMDLGVRRPDGSRFGRGDVPGALLLPDGIEPGAGFIVYGNFNVIRRYNPSDLYALAVGMLGDAALT